MYNIAFNIKSLWSHQAIIKTIKIWYKKVTKSMQFKLFKTSCCVNFIVNFYLFKFICQKEVKVV